MKTIGLIGGMSWESSAQYYRFINEHTRASVGGLHSARSLMLSVDFHEIERMQTDERWEDAGVALAQAAQALERGGADCVVLCTNTMHKVADVIASSIRIPFLHIVEATARAIRHASLTRVGLLGTRFTMEEDFYVRKLAQASAAEVITPDAAGRQLMHRIIYEELCVGAIVESSRRAVQRIIAGLEARGAQGVVLGCTEIGLLVRGEDVDLPLFDTTTLHARAAVEFALS